MPARYSDEPTPRRRRNPLKPYLTVLVILLILFAVIIALLFMRLQDTNKQLVNANEKLQATKSELSRIQTELLTATPTPTPAPTPNPSEAPEASEAPEGSPEATPEATPEVTPEPSPTPFLRLYEAVTDDMLNGVFRGEEQCWFESPKTGVVTCYMLSVHWGPGMQFFENMALNQNDEVEILAQYQNWSLLRTKLGYYGWAVSELMHITDPAEATAAEATAEASGANLG